MNYLSTKYGLVTDNDPVTENGQLFLAVYYLLMNLMGQDAELLNNWMKVQLFNSKVEEGLYHRNPDLTDRRVMSNDNLSGIFSWSFTAKTEQRFEIWKYMMKHWGTYDNTKGKSTQFSKNLPFNPSNYFIWGLCAESRIYLLFLPFFILGLLNQFRKSKNDTSGKILSWVEMYPHKDHWLVKYLFKAYEYRMRKQYGQDYLKELFRIYHGGNSVDFPIRKLLEI